MLRLPHIVAIVFFSGLSAFAVFGRFQDSNGNTGAVAVQSMAKVPGEPAPFALIELFTSEGCSSCPSADRNLEQIAASAAASGQEVYTLSYHVDYWNYLGWKDPYSDVAYSDRQREYAQQFRSSRIYTPQMVVNGQVEFVGSNKKKSDRAVKAALDLGVDTAITLAATLDGEKIRVDWQATGIDAGNALKVVLVQNKGEQQVKRGENARRKLTHVNIVRHLETVQQPAANGQIEFATPDGFRKDNFHVLAFVQSPTTVDAVAKSTIGAKSDMSSMKKAIDGQKAMKGTKKDGAMKAPDGDLHRVALRKTDAAYTSVGISQQAEKTLVGYEKFMEMLRGNPRVVQANLADIESSWDMAYVPMLLEVGRFMPTRQRAPILEVLESKTGQKFGIDADKWRQWNWKQQYEPHPDYAKFKSELYSKIDPRFAEYFVEPDGAKIRLDEIRWGGVHRDGIPPLKDPKMLEADEATYLADSDVVFGIELNGDARAYPNRILAWHEMFKDTIGGESVCGVY